jgi:DNA-binding MarR family transcriptional regulator
MARRTETEPKPEPASDGDPDVFDAWRAVLLAHHACARAIEGDLEAAGTIPLGWYDVLLELRAEPDGLRMQDLGDRVVLSRTRVSRLVDELEREGLVARRPDPADGRAAIATVTPAGERAFRAAAPAYRASVEARVNAHLSARERSTVAAGLRRVADANAAPVRPARRRTVSRAAARARG